MSTPETSSEEPNKFTDTLSDGTEVTIDRDKINRLADLILDDADEDPQYAIGKAFEQHTAVGFDAGEPIDPKEAQD